MTALAKIVVSIAVLFVLTMPTFACEPCKTGYTEVNGKCEPNPTPTPAPTPAPVSSPVTVTTTTTNTNTNANNNTNTLSQGQQQGQKQGQQQSSASTSAANASNANNSTGNTTTVTGDTTNNPRQTPMAYAPDNLNTSPCALGFSGGGSGPMGALALGITRIDKGCDSRQTAVIFHSLGNDTAAAEVLCSTDAAKRAHLTIEKCALMVPRVQPPAPAPAPVATPQPIIINPPSITVLPAPVIMQQIATPAPGQLPPALAVPALQKKVHKAIVPPKGSGIKPCPTSLSTKDNCWEND
jgi:hypothetical protein